MLRLSQDMTQGRIVQWMKREGDSVEEGEAVVSVETDKTEVEIQAPQSGILRKILVGAGEDADVGTPLAILGEAEEDIRELLETAGKRPPKPVSAVPTVRSGKGCPGSARPRRRTPAYFPTGKEGSEGTGCGPLASYGLRRRRPRNA